MNGSIDEVMIFNRSLNASEIKMLYEGSRLGGSNLSSDLTEVGDVWKVGVTGLDYLGNGSETLSNNVAITDATPPKIQFVSPTETSGLTVNRNYIQINVTAYDNESAIKNITIYLYNSTSLVNSTNSSNSPLFVNFTGLNDGIYYFNATAYDLWGNLNFTETRNITLYNKIIAFSLPIDTVDFGNMTIGEQKANLTGIQIQNDGNVYLDIEVSASSLFSSGVYPGDNYLFRVGDAGKGNETNGTYSPSSAISWTQFNSTPQLVIYYLNYSSTRNLAALQINISVPLDEPAGLKQSIITITGFES